jgi:hypothetical protein
MQIRAEIYRSRKNTSAILAFTFSEELFKPLPAIEQSGFIIRHNFSSEAPLIEEITKSGRGQA